MLSKENFFKFLLNKSHIYILAMLKLISTHEVLLSFAVPEYIPSKTQWKNEISWK